MKQPPKSMASGTPRQGDIPSANKKNEGRITRAWVDFTGGVIYVHAMFFACTQKVHQKWRRARNNVEVHALSVVQLHLWLRRKHGTGRTQ